jgi:lipopolysaccharide biosynthesis glycosyltransferase
MNKQCIVYITDKNYTFPTLLSAIQAREHCRKETDILVLLSEKIPDFAELSDVLSEYSVQLYDYHEIFSESLNKLDGANFQKKISKTTMCRLLLDKFLPDQYEQIIYIDGDTQVWNSLEALEAFQVPSGRFLGCPDYATVKDFVDGKPLIKYFNAGVLKFNRDGWIGQEAFDLYLEKNTFKFHDQEALNIVGQEALIYISNKWNYPKQFLSILPDEIKPSIVHFMAHPKPWHGVYYPWGRREYAFYTKAREASPILNKYFYDLSFTLKCVYRYRSIKERLTQKNIKQQTEKMRELFRNDFAI